MDNKPGIAVKAVLFQTTTLLSNIWAQAQVPKGYKGQDTAII
jgi:hypothetical protein